MENVEQRVKKIVAEQLGVNEAEIKNESSFVDDLGADSLDTVELVMALEEEFETEIPDEEAEKITTVQQAIDYIGIARQEVISGAAVAGSPAPGAPPEPGSLRVPGRRGPARAPAAAFRAFRGPRTEQPRSTDRRHDPPPRRRHRNGHRFAGRHRPRRRLGLDPQRALRRRARSRASTARRFRRGSPPR